MASNLVGLLRKRPRESTASAASAQSQQPRVVVHYDERRFPVPFAFDAAFPSEPYRSRRQEVKTAIHWGQRKLLLSEIQLLSHYARPGVSYHIVYAGSAPGTHLGFLDDLTNQRHTWELVDPGQFDRNVLGCRSNFLLRNEFFTNATAYGINATRLQQSRLLGLCAVYRHVAVESVQHTTNELHARLNNIIGTLDVARGTTDIPSMYEAPLVLPTAFNLLCHVAMERKPLLFVSDIRSGSVLLDNFEEHVAENMRAQQTWTEILEADFAMLKFRLPYTQRLKAAQDGKDEGELESAASRCVTSSLIDSDGCVEYLDGELLLPIWTRPTSTEGRLVVPAGARRKRYNVRHVEDQFFFFNSKLREVYHFNHLLAPHPHLDGHFDSAAEVQCLQEYCIHHNPALADPSARAQLVQAISRTSNRITQHLRIDFQRAIHRRDNIILRQARFGLVLDNEDDEDRDEDAGACGDAQQQHAQHQSWEAEAKRFIELAAVERLRPLWWRNLTANKAPPPITGTDASPRGGDMKTLWRAMPMPQV